MGRRPTLLLRLGLLAPVLAALLASAPASAATGEPELGARAWVLIDAESGDRLAARASSRSLPIASATKLMTARLALAALPLDRRLRVPPYAALPAESVVGFDAGERVSVRDLIVALLLPSANDAAVALAEGVSGSIPAFVRRMNREAGRLGLDRSSYSNPIGLDDPDNYSSAGDLARLARRLRADRRFERIVAKPEATLRSGARSRRVTTRNTLLLSDPTVDGIKTGHTLGAGYVLVASADRDGTSLLSVLLGAGSEADRDRETARLLDYGFSLYRERRPIRADQELGTVGISHEDGRLALVARRGVKVSARRDERIETELLAPEEIEGPVAAGEPVGRAAVVVDGDRVDTVAALAAREVPPPGPLEQVGAPLAAGLVAGGSMLVGVAVIVGLRRRRSDSGQVRTTEQRAESRRLRARRREGKRT